MAGFQAKADALCCYVEHVGGSEDSEIDLARSLAADLRNIRGG